MIEIEHSDYMLAGVVHGNTVHATATVTKENEFLHCNDLTMTTVTKCFAT